ncbi:MAG: hypothetical protein ABIQ44_02715, partial [Chloroflexia bacterium]
MNRRRSGLAFVLFASIFALFVAAIWFVSGSGAANAQTDIKTQSAPNADICGNSWYDVHDALATETDVELYTTSAISSNDIWAVGRHRPPGGSTTSGYAAHWDGVAWSPIPAPTFAPQPYETFNSVAAISHNNVWVVGWACASSPCTSLIEHWNGTAFSIVPSPNAPGASTSLFDIAAISANDIWAVGSTNASGVRRTLTMHWNGFTWSIIAAPDTG